MTVFDPRQVQQLDARQLAQGYSPAIRALDVASIVVFFAVVIWQALRLAAPLWENPWLGLAALLGGYLFADFISGFVHWLADTWGRVDMPILGKAFLRPFREHHVDPQAITRHDFIETNGNNCLICVPVGIAALFVPLDSAWVLFGLTTLLSAMLWVFGTNQFHKWSHLEHPPRWIAFLQAAHIVLPKDHHDIHHRAPFATHYCITAGWMNRPLAAIRFFPTLEKLGTALFGAIPRQEDLGTKAALALQAQQQAEADRLAAERGAAEAGIQIAPKA